MSVLARMAAYYCDRICSLSSNLIFSGVSQVQHSGLAVRNVKEEELMEVNG